ncbi:hypothetical protein ACFFX0_13240 [Citricoccus parietis]|uniref:Uncharacterized protein n=1 Tax=Citricoccus parietis TaxID=592307 RepID=A0ABV5FZP1_9MICC
MAPWHHGPRERFCSGGPGHGVLRRDRRRRRPLAVRRGTPGLADPRGHPHAAHAHPGGRPSGGGHCQLLRVPGAGHALGERRGVADE